MANMFLHYQDLQEELQMIEYWTTIVVYKNNKEVSRSIGETSRDAIYKAIESSI